MSLFNHLSIATFNAAGLTNNHFKIVKRLRSRMYTRNATLRGLVLLFDLWVRVQNGIWLCP